MKHAHRSRPDIARVNAIAKSLRLWVLEIVVWMAGIIGVRFKPDISEEIYAAKLCVFLHAVARCPHRGRAIRAGRARAAPRGVRFQNQRSALRAYTRSLRIHNLAELRDLLDDMEPAIARMVKRLTRYSVVVRPVAFAPPADVLMQVAPQLMPTPADTS